MDRGQTHFQSLNKAEMEAALIPDSVALPLAWSRVQICSTPSFAAKASYTTSKCIISLVLKTLTDAIATIDVKSRRGEGM
jgi:hypothetical protein